MSDRKEYLKKYRLEHKEKYREYQRKYRGTHLSTYEKLQHQNQKYKEVIDDAIQFIKDTCIEQVPDMPKGCYREIASIGDLLDLLDILKEVEETDTNVGEVE